MKKRLISLLLTLVMLVSLVSVFSVSASADTQTATVTLASGDTVIGLCQKYGIDYYAYRSVIMSLNGITDESQFKKLAVGTKITLPISNAAAASLAGTSTATTVASTSTTGLTTGTVSTLPTGDYVAYYLVNYTIRSGETIGGIYSSLGESYKTYQNQIVNLNNLTNINTVSANKALLLPTTSTSLSGSVGYTVVAHVMKSGETAQGVVTGSYGQSWNTTTTTLLQKLNNRTNLNYFRVGEIMYIPISGVVTINNTTNNTGSSTSGTVNTDGTYNIVSQNATNGSFDVRVGGKSVSKATAGQTVQIIATPSAGYAASSISVTKVGDAATAVTVTNNSFVMPAYAVSVSVSFSTAIESNITVNNVLNGSLIATVNGEKVTKAYSGSQVIVKATPDTGCVLDYIRVTYNDNKDTVAVENGIFTMPAFPVTVTAVFKADPNYTTGDGSKIHVDVANATVVATVNDAEVTSAKPGDVVTLSVTPDSGYVVESVKVYNQDFSEVISESTTFTMPEGGKPVNVVVSVKASQDAVLNITKINTDEGSFKVTVDGKETATATPGQTVKIEGSSSLTYWNYYIYVTKTGDESTSVEVNQDTHTFVMPEYPVNVRVDFTVFHNITVNNSNNKGSVGVSRTRAIQGEWINVNVWNVQNGYAQGSIVLTYADNSTHTITGTGFTMPDCDVKVTVNFNTKETLYAEGALVRVNGEATSRTNNGNSYTVLGTSRTDNDKDPQKISVGATTLISVVPSPAIGFTVENVYYTYTESGKTVSKDATLDTATGNWTFEMPKYDVHVYVIFKAVSTYNITVVGQPDSSVGTAKVSSIYGETYTAAKDTRLYVTSTVGDGYAFDADKVKIYKTGDSSNYQHLEYFEHYFDMPAYDVTVDLSGCYTDNKHTINIVDDGIGLADSVDIQNLKLTAVINGNTYTAKQLKDMRIDYGTVVTIVAEVKEGYALDLSQVLDNKYPIIVTRTDDKTNVTVALASANSFTFKMPLSNVDVTAMPLGMASYNIVANPSVNGTYSVPASAAWNTAVNISDIVPAEGYKFDYASISYTDAKGEAREVKLADRAIPEFNAMPQSAVTVSVFFTAATDNKLTVDSSSWPESSDTSTVMLDVSVSGELKTNASSYDVPTDALVTVTRHEENANKNVVLNKITVLDSKGQEVAVTTNGSTYSFNMPAGGATINADFESLNADVCAISVSVSHGTVSEFNASVPYEEVSEQTISFTPEAGYDANETKAAVTWTEANDKVHTNELVATVNVEERVITLPEDMNVMPGTTVNVSYSCTVKQVTLKGICSENDCTWTFTADGEAVEDSAPYGSTVVATVTPKEGKMISGVEILDYSNNKEITATKEGNSFTFTVPDTDSIYVNATCEKLVNKVTINVTGEGNVKQNSYLVTSGETINGTYTGPDSSITLTPENENQEMTVEYSYNGGAVQTVEKNEKGAYTVPITDYTGSYVINVTMREVKHKLNDSESAGITIENAEGTKVTTAKRGDTLYIKPAEGKNFDSTKLEVKYLSKEDGSLHSSTEKDSAIKTNMEGETWVITIPTDADILATSNFDIYAYYKSVPER